MSALRHPFFFDVPKLAVYKLDPNDSSLCSGLALYSVSVRMWLVCIPLAVLLWRHIRRLRKNQRVGLQLPLRGRLHRHVWWEMGSQRLLVYVGGLIRPVPREVPSADLQCVVC